MSAVGLYKRDLEIHFSTKLFGTQARQLFTVSLCYRNKNLSELKLS